MDFPSLIVWSCPMCKKTHRSVLDGEVPVAMFCPACGYICGVKLFKVDREAVAAEPPKEGQ
jgi:hypothetical protein